MCPGLNPKNCTHSSNSCSTRYYPPPPHPPHPPHPTPPKVIEASARPEQQEKCVCIKMWRNAPRRWRREHKPAPQLLTLRRGRELGQSSPKKNRPSHKSREKTGVRQRVGHFFGATSGASRAPVFFSTCDLCVGRTKLRPGAGGVLTMAMAATLRLPWRETQMCHRQSKDLLTWALGGWS